MKKSMILSLLFIVQLIARGQAKPPVQSITYEANKKASEAIHKYFLFSCNKSGSIYSGEKMGYDGYRLCEYKSIKWGVVARKLTEADKLNGIQWNGQITMHFNSMRNLSILDSEFKFGFDVRSDERWSAWGDISDAEINIHLQKKNGRWQDYGATAPRIPWLYASDTTISCSTVKRLQIARN